jgi:hypothetical protein
LNQRDSDGPDTMSEAPRHFVAYHKVDERGPLLSDEDGGGRFETNKPSKPRKGDVLWCIEGEGSPKKFRLATRGMVARQTTDSDGTSILHYKAHRRHGAALVPEAVSVSGLVRLWPQCDS